MTQQKDVKVGTPLAPLVAAAAAASKTNGAPKPAAALAVPAPARRPTVLERMRAEVVPLEELLAARAEIEASAKTDDDRYRAEHEETRTYLADLTAIRREFGGILGGKKRRHGEGSETSDTARDSVVQQLKLRKAIIAKRLGENEMRAFDAFDRIMDGIDRAEHFGDFGFVLREAQRAGFIVEINDQQYQAEVGKGRKHLVFSFRGKKYFPVKFDSWRLSRTLAWEIRHLHSRCLDRADEERAVQYRMLESGAVPASRKFLDVITGKGELKKPYTCGAVLVDAAFRDPKTQTLFRFSGVTQLSFFDRDGKRFVAIQGVNGSVSQALAVETAPVSLKKSETTHSALWLLRHLFNVANGALMTDEHVCGTPATDKKAEVRGHNAKVQAIGHVEDLQPATKAEREFRFAELRGDDWRKRNSRWIERFGAKALADAIPLPIPAISAEAVAAALVNAVMPNAR
ncbi:MAG: hypothetical protein V1723_03685 [Candidatus Uhrbacteria bacterium]